MEQGDWNAAAQHFALALHAAKDQARAAEASAYLAAVRLVEAQVAYSEVHRVEVPIYFTLPPGCWSGLECPLEKDEGCQGT